MTDSPQVSPPAPPPVPVERVARVGFTGRRQEFRRLVLRGTLLELVTFGFYRFWLATDMRRHLWSNTSVEGDAAEYTGTALELLIGFLFALAILVPIYIVYFLIGIEAESAQTFASFPLVLFFYAFGQFAIYRARRYRATRTVWRGVRFWMTGSGWDYSWRACLWGLLVGITLGLALPWRDAALERFKMRHTHYGDLDGRFVGTGWQLFKKGWWLWLLSFLMITIPFTYPAYSAISWRWWISGIRIGDVRLQSQLSGGAFMGLYWAVIGWGLLIVALDAALIGGAIAIIMFGAGSSDFQIIVQLVAAHPYMAYAANIANYIIIALAVGFVMRLYLLRGLWERVANSVTVHNLGAADNVRARGGTTNALGEGFANSFDVVGF